MGEQGAESCSCGRITRSSLNENTLALKTVSFVLDSLPAWRDDPDRPSETSENKMNLQLCKFLDVRARSYFPMVRFDHEEYQGGQRSVDLSVSSAQKVFLGARTYSIYEPILLLECKRLPAPSEDREREYVTGGPSRTSGGIQRFKLGLHGEGMRLVVMIGYLQARTAREWHREINGWILQLSEGNLVDFCEWNKDEILGPLEVNPIGGVATCESAHRRRGGSKSWVVSIRHLWVEMTFRPS